MINTAIIQIGILLANIKKGKCSIKVIIEGITEDKGQMIISLYNNKDGFPAQPQKAFKQFKSPIRKKKSELLIEDLQPGEYALSAFQDEEMTGKISLGFFGIPKEKVGVSNNPKSTFIPSYADARFNLSENLKMITIIIK